MKMVRLAGYEKLDLDAAYHKRYEDEFLLNIERIVFIHKIQVHGMSAYEIVLDTEDVIITWDISNLKAALGTITEC